MSSRNRRSMGTKVGLQPQRVSLEQQPESASKGAAAGRFSKAAPPQSGSRIPRPGSSLAPTKGGGVRGRSSSSFAPASAFVTPSSNLRSRSSSAKRTSAQKKQLPPPPNLRTPQRVLKPHNPAAAARYSITGSGRKSSVSGRKSSIGGSSIKGTGAASRDSRQLGDKAFNAAAIDDIIRFLAAAGYAKALSHSDFPLNSTEFKGVFQFLMSIITDGEYEVSWKIVPVAGFL